MYDDQPEPEPEEYEQKRFSIVMPFWIDTDAYTERDKEMFVCGVEFEMLRQELLSGEEVNRTIHNENESRARMMAGKLQRKCELNPTGYPGWTYFTAPAIHGTN